MSRGSFAHRMSDPDPHVAMVYAALGRRAPALWWSRVEILLGLASVGLGLIWVDEPGTLAWTGSALVTLGGYLALAGHRSHIYDAMTRQTGVIWARLGVREPEVAAEALPDREHARVRAVQH